MLGQGMAGSSGGGAGSSHSYTCGQEQWSIYGGSVHHHKQMTILQTMKSKTYKNNVVYSGALHSYTQH